MARVSYIQDDDATGDTAELFESNFKFVGRMANFHRILGHVPWMYRWYVPLQLSTRLKGICVLDGRTTHLAHIRTSVVNQCEYCMHHNLTSGAASGVLNETELEALQDPKYPIEELFNERDSAVIRWIDAVALNTARHDDAAFDAVRSHLSEVEVVELTVTIGIRTMANRIQEALHTELEDDSFPVAGHFRTTSNDEALYEYSKVVSKQLERRVAAAREAAATDS